MGQSDEKRYQAIVENLNDVVYTTDINAAITYISPNIQRIGGYLPSEVVGRSFADFVHPDDLPGRIDHFQKILTGANEPSEYRMLTKSGTPRWVRTSARTIVTAGKVVGIQGVLVDISDRKATEKALRHSKERYRLLVENARDAIFVIQDKRVVFMNASAIAIVGYSPDDQLADLTFDQFIHPDDRERIVARHLQRLAGAVLNDHASFRIICKDQSVKHVNLNAVLIEWEGKPAVLNFLRDITTEMQQSEKARHSQKLEALGTLAGGIAHNFNNLLMGIQGNASLALIQLDASHPLRTRLEKIMQLVQNGARLTGQLLQYTRGGHHHIKRVDLNQVVSDVSATLAATQKQVCIRLQLAADLPPIEADRQQIEQVLINLLLNAAEAMPDGGDVRIATTCLPDLQAVAPTPLSAKGPCVRLEVADSGPGMSRATLERIFEPFFTTKGLGRGTGLGLSTAFGIIKSHGGHIEVNSAPGHGTCVRFYLPAIAHPEVQATRPASSDPHTFTGTLLLVDDETSILETSAQLLTYSGFTVLKASSGRAALALYQHHHRTIDLVVLDMVMPGMSAKTLLQRMREVHPDVKVLLSSGYGMDEQARALLLQGCVGFLQKPYDFNAMLTTIQRLLPPAG
ncbi:MAG: PAS domain S-box protein [Desulfatitalea sp.]|nr:PAS domain S-box protein [Desulfatitalea sp.]